MSSSLKFVIYKKYFHKLCIIFVLTNEVGMDKSEISRLKVLPETLRRRVDLPEEIKLARESAPHIWFQCLKLSREYKDCCEQNGKGELAETYSKFGNVFDYPHFDIWWRKVGRSLFIEEKPLKKVRVIEDEKSLDKVRIDNDKLIIEIPLTVRKQTVMRQIGKELKKLYENREIDILKQSTAKVKLEKSKMQMTTAQLLLDIIRLRNRYPKYSLAKIGQLAGVELDLFARTTKAIDLAVGDEDYENRRMTIAVSRYTAQANKLIHDAVRGKFPMLKKKKT